MVTPIEMKPKTLFRGLLELSKKSKNSQKYGKLSKLHHSQVGEFWKNAQREILLKIKFFANGIDFYSFLEIQETHKGQQISKFDQYGKIGLEINQILKI